MDKEPKFEQYFKIILLVYRFTPETENVLYDIGELTVHKTTPWLNREMNAA